MASDRLAARRHRPPSPIGSKSTTGSSDGGNKGVLIRRRTPSPSPQPQEYRHCPAATTTMSTMPGELSPRADLWAVLVVASAAVLASLSRANNEGSSLELAALSAAVIAMIAALLAAVQYRFRKGRERLTAPLRDGGWTTRELALATFSFVLWCVVVGVVQNGGNHLAAEGLEIANGNLFYSSWASFGLVSYMVADLLTIEDLGGVVPYDHIPTNQIGRTWILLLVASLVLLSFNVAVVSDDTCAGDILMDTSLCQRAIAGILLSILGALTTIASLLVARVFPKRAPPVGMALSFFEAILFIINAAVVTGPGAPGSQPSSLYWASWACFALAMYLCVSHVEAYAESRTSSDGSTSSERAPRVHQMHSSHKEAASRSTASHTTVSESTYEEEGGASYSSGSATTEEYAEPQLAALLPAMDDGRDVGGDKSRLANQGAYQAREESKQRLFDELGRSPTTNAGPNTVTTAEGFERNLAQYLVGLQLPTGVASLVLNNHCSTDSRLWLLDNSSPMNEADSCKPGGGLDVVQRLGPVSRWDEQRDCVAFHAKMASRCWIPTKFWLVNDPGPQVGEQKFSLCWRAPIDIPEEMNGVQRVMTKASPGLRKNALGLQVKSVKKGVAREEERLTNQDKYITLVMCTHGVPTDGQGRGGPALLREFQQSLSALSHLPVKVVVRLCTGDENILATSDDMLEGGHLDVMSNYWREATKVSHHNPWLTYGIGIHRLREAGLAWGLAEGLTRRPLTPDQIHSFCTRLLLGENEDEIELPHPRKWLAFMRTLRTLLKKEEPIWNPIANRQTPWINLTKLHSIYGAEGQNIAMNA